MTKIRENSHHVYLAAVNEGMDVLEYSELPELGSSCAQVQRPFSKLLENAVYLALKDCVDHLNHFISFLFIVSTFIERCQQTPLTSQVP